MIAAGPEFASSYKFFEKQNLPMNCVEIIVFLTNLFFQFHDLRSTKLMFRPRFVIYNYMYYINSNVH